MKKLMSFLAAVACLGTLAACATTGAVAGSEEDDLAKLKRQNAELRQQLSGPRPVQSPVMAPSLADMVPPPAQHHAMTPANWAWLNQPPEGCEHGVFSMRIENRTDYFVDMMLNGERLKVRGSRGLLPGIPPNESVYICLGNIGVQSFVGTLFACRGGPLSPRCELQQVGTFKYRASWGADTVSYGSDRQVLQVRPPYIDWK